MRVHTHLLMRRERKSENERQKLFFFFDNAIGSFQSVVLHEQKNISMNVFPFLPVITQACPPCMKYLQGKHAHCHTNTTPCSFIRSLTDGSSIPQNTSSYAAAIFISVLSRAADVTSCA